jgi:hypothetical protein
MHGPSVRAQESQVQIANNRLRIDAGVVISSIAAHTRAMPLAHVLQHSIRGPR